MIKGLFHFAPIAGQLFSFFGQRGPDKRTHGKGPREDREPGEDGFEGEKEAAQGTKDREDSEQQIASRRQSRRGSEFGLAADLCCRDHGLSMRRKGEIIGNESND